MIARNTNADVNVIALIGERRREVLEFYRKRFRRRRIKKKRYNSSHKR